MSLLLWAVGATPQTDSDDDDDGDDDECGEDYERCKAVKCTQDE